MGDTKKIWEKAKQTASDKEELKNTAFKAGEKLKKLLERSEGFQELNSKLKVLIRMIKSHTSGEYRAFQISTLALISFALVYFIIPTDIIPDFIPALGFTDDASVVLLIARRVSKDIDRFLAWEQEQFEQAN